MEEPMTAKPFRGITDPISTSDPSPEELIRQEDMEQYLRSRDDVFESTIGYDKRSGIVAKLTKMFCTWAEKLLLEQGVPAGVATNGGGIQVRLFGSTRLNVNAPDADIDCLCIAPNGVTRDDFFTSFCGLLQERMDVNDVFPVPEAYTPVLKFTMDAQPVDMIFVALTFCPIPSDFDITKMNNINGLEEQDIRSLNGSRVAECIFSAVPNVPCFRLALRAIKHWARQRGIYSNILGFLSGCSCAIMVAFVCQRFPNACAATIVENFFLIFSHWHWSAQMPVLLNEMESREPQSIEEILSDSNSNSTHSSAASGAAPSSSSSSSSTGPSGGGSVNYIRVWNPRLTPTDSHQLMPVITPAYPAMNAAYNVAAPQFRRIQEEIQRAQVIIQSAYVQHATQQQQQQAATPTSPASCVRINWKELCDSCANDYFKAYSRYIRIEICSRSDEQHRFWFGWCESKLRQFILSLEQPPEVFCHPQSNWYHQRDQAPASATESVTSSTTATTTAAVGKSTPVRGGAASSNVVSPAKKQCEFKSTFFVGLSFVSGLPAADLTPVVEEFLRSSNQWGGKKPGMKAIFKHLRQQEIPEMVYKVKAEPSNVSSCTPLKTKMLNTCSFGQDDFAAALSGQQQQQQQQQQVRSYANVLSSASASASPRDMTISSMQTSAFNITSNGSLTKKSKAAGAGAKESAAGGAWGGVKTSSSDVSTIVNEVDEEGSFLSSNIHNVEESLENGMQLQDQQQQQEQQRADEEHDLASRLIA